MMVGYVDVQSPPVWQGAFSFVVLGCKLGQLDQFDRMLIVTIGPLLLISVLLFLVGLMRLTLETSAAYPWIRRAYLLALGIMFLSHPNVSVEIVRSIVCDAFDDGSRYLDADYSISCYSRRYRVMYAYRCEARVVHLLGLVGAVE